MIRVHKIWRRGRIILIFHPDLLSFPQLVHRRTGSTGDAAYVVVIGNTYKRQVVSDHFNTSCFSKACAYLNTEQESTVNRWREYASPDIEGIAKVQDNRLVHHYLSSCWWFVCRFSYIECNTWCLHGICLMTKEDCSLLIGLDTLLFLWSFSVFCW